MTCDACARAKVNPRIDMWTNGCESCKARALAATGAHLDSVEANAITPSYRDALQAMFGAGWKQGHEAVKLWASMMPKTTTKRGGK